MTHPTRAGIGLIRVGDSDFVLTSPEDDVRGKDVYDAEGQRIGSVDDLYIDGQEREVPRRSTAPLPDGRELSFAALPYTPPISCATVNPQDLKVM
jgi:PRC-barrel domain protein